ncbi:uncharacterized protein LOC132030764 [Lycium ferocissimum]|uniref:uncharacterized protein LOC132030764 n=1 Tax=Lycium ferocissimum TaxID=112874 RepID=UPI002814DB99|nr:uncharacterized protein LOC132030764 [Lycium ferocissimum]XP_059276488.1 uncharacterized protein LOC132030764 [Lycium ferocissimum]
MAGMLPGVEHARRRRFHQRSGNNWLNSSSFCLYTSNYDQFHLSSSSSKQRSAASHAYQDEKLIEISRKAKQRLDKKLSGQWNLESKWSTNNRQKGQGFVCKEVFGLKKSVSKRFINWAKMGWKSSEQDECIICLDQFRIMDNLMQLPCAHRFHSKCLEPWLESNANCPACRMKI